VKERGYKMNSKEEFKSLDKSLKKQRIIDTAAALFHKKGYRSTTIDDVSRELGLSKAALYHYVSTKDRLLSIIYTQAFENIFRDTNKISRMDLPPDEKLRRIVRYHIKNIIIKSLPMFSVFFSEENQLPRKDFQKIREEKKKYTSIIEKIIEEGVSEGLFKKVDPKLQAYAMLGMCNWIYKWFKPDRTAYSPDEIADHFIALLEAGYLKEDTEEDSVGSVISKDAIKKGESDLKQRIYALKRQCGALTSMIEELEKVL
jgi:AcrR family transcriptional regulator